MPSKSRPGPGAPQRRALARVSRPLLIKLTALPRWVVPLITLGLALVGLIVGGVVGFVALTIIAVFLAWLAALSWPVLSPPQRLVRAAVIAVVAGAAVYLLAA